MEDRSFGSFGFVHLNQKTGSKNWFVRSTEVGVSVEEGCSVLPSWSPDWELSPVWESSPDCEFPSFSGVLVEVPHPTKSRMTKLINNIDFKGFMYPPS